MSLAQRIRDFRYSKGWGPDELANRAEISRTALYQIESGKTELPRAGTLRRIAVALEIPMEELLGSGTEPHVIPAPVGRMPGFHSPRARMRWPAMDEGAVRVNSGSPFSGLAPNMVDDPRHAAETTMKARTLPAETPFAREGEVMSKLHELLRSPFCDCITSIVDDLHNVLTQVSTIN
jgi:transcriptional regulator with XRE-family HTH domain